MMRVCYFGTYRDEYSRNQIMIAALRSAGVEVIECNARLWTSDKDRVDAISFGWSKPKFWLRVSSSYFLLLRKYFQIPKIDILIIGYPGQFDVFIAKIISIIWRKPLVWDVFMSIYLISLERRLDTSNPRIVNYLKYIEKVGLKLPDLLILDTPQYVQWFAKTYGISPDRFALVPTGADDRVFQPHKHKLNNGIDDFIQEDSIRILYYGSYIPNHDVKSIIEAAFILRREKYKFVLIGEGPEREEAQKLAENKNLENVEFIDWLEKNELLHQIDRADIILGAFGETPQSLMTIQNKIFEGMAMCKPVVTGRSEAVQAVFRHNESIYLCNRHDPISLADAIRTLSEHASLRRSIAQNGNRIFKENFSVSVLGCKYKTHIRKLIDN